MIRTKTFEIPDGLYCFNATMTEGVERCCPGLGEGAFCQVDDALLISDEDNEGYTIFKSLLCLSKQSKGEMINEKELESIENQLADSNAYIRDTYTTKKLISAIRDQRENAVKAMNKIALQSNQITKLQTENERLKRDGALSLNDSECSLDKFGHCRRL